MTEPRKKYEKRINSFILSSTVFKSNPMNSGSTETEASEPTLNVPDESWIGFFRNHFGPGVLWALLGIGASHVILTPQLGSMYGFFGVWIAALVYGVKYGGWELGVRYLYGTGKNPVEGYSQLPGPGRWGQWLTGFIYFFGWTVVLSAVTASTAAFAMAIFPVPEGTSLLSVFAILIITAGIPVVVFGKQYRWLEWMLKAFVLGLAGLIVLGIFVSPPDPETIAGSLFDVPDVTSTAFLGLFAAFAGYTPTGLSTSVAVSSWSVAKEQGAQALRNQNLDPNSEKFRKYVQSWIRTGRRDFNIGYLFSLFLILCMLSLSASVLYPDPVTDRNVAVRIAGLLEKSFGTWTRIAMLVGVFAALFSTMITVLDAASRVCADVVSLIRNENGSEETYRKTFAGVICVLSILPVLAIGELPVTLVRFSAALMAVVQVFFYGANFYLVRTELPEFAQPSRTAILYYGASILIVLIFGIMGAVGKLGLVGS